MGNNTNDQDQDVDFNFNYGNFNPDDVQADEIIDAVFVVDTSASIGSFVKDLNSAFNDFVQTMQKSHVAEKLFVSVLTFDEVVKVTNGFQPIANIPVMDFGKNLGGATALYAGAKQGIENAMSYRKTLENSGVNVKTLIFVITDGEDNHSGQLNVRSSDVKKMIEDIKKDESTVNSFTTILFGVGNATHFEAAKDAMGIDFHATVGATGAELRKMIGFISASISSTSSGQKVSAPAF
jgi:uncharacterized protein YegL